MSSEVPTGEGPDEASRVRLFSASGVDPFDAPTGDAPTGDAPTGDAPAGEVPADEVPVDDPDGDPAEGDAAGGDDPAPSPRRPRPEPPIGAPPERSTAIVNAGPASLPPPAFTRENGSTDRPTPRRRKGSRRSTERETSPRWRSSSIRSRIMSLVALGVVITALVSMIGSIAVGEIDDRATTVTELAEARRHNIQAADSLRELQLLADTPGVDDPAIGELLRRHTTAVARLESALGGDARFDDDLDEAAALDAEYLEGVDTNVPVGPGDAGALDDALAARQAIDDTLAERGVVARDELASARTTAVLTLVLVVLVTAVVLPALGLAVTRSIVDPLRRVGRAMRRFGDGDLRARATEAPDEVGALARSFNALADGAGRRIRDLSSDAERGTQLRVITEALELATEEDDVHRIVEHATAILAPGVNLEMLVNDPGSSRLRQVAVNPTATAPNCPVPDTAGCVAIRRGHTVTFDRPDSLNACPWLRDRPKGPCSAVCVPANAGGHVLGVLHATAAVGSPPSADVIEQMVTIASQASTRIGSMRTLETTRTLAATDTLTGLANRRSVESRIGDLLRTGSPFVLAVADLDHFKQVNDNYGHEFGDRALQLFAEVLAENVRGHDLVARFGGEEFVLVYPGMDVQRSMEVIERIRVALARAVQQGGMPEFTCSFGITHSSVAGDVETIIRIADAGLLLAKERGRNRVVYADADIAASVFDHDPANGRRRPRNPDPVPDVESEDDTF